MEIWAPVQQSTSICLIMGETRLIELTSPCMGYARPDRAREVRKWFSQAAQVGMTEGKHIYFIVMCICAPTFHSVRDPLPYTGAHHHIPEAVWSCCYGLSCVLLTGSCSHRAVVQLLGCAEGANTLLFSRTPTIFTHGE